MSEISTDKTFLLNVVSAHEGLFSGNVKMVFADSVQGELGIFPRHSPLLTLLRPGELRIVREDGNEEYLYISGGTLEIQPEEVTILADTALRSEQIDEEAARSAKARAEEELERGVLYTDRDRARAELVNALAQLKTLEDARRRRKGR